MAATIALKSLSISKQMGEHGCYYCSQNLGCLQTNGLIWLLLGVLKPLANRYPPIILGVMTLPNMVNTAVTYDCCQKLGKLLKDGLTCCCSQKFRQVWYGDNFREKSKPYVFSVKFKKQYDQFVIMLLVK